MGICRRLRGRKLLRLLDRLLGQGLGLGLIIGVFFLVEGVLGALEMFKNVCAERSQQSEQIHAQLVRLHALLRLLHLILQLHKRLQELPVRFEHETTRICVVLNLTLLFESLATLALEVADGGVGVKPQFAPPKRLATLFYLLCGLRLLRLVCFRMTRLFLLHAHIRLSH